MIHGVLHKIKLAYGFTADPNCSINHNVSLQLQAMPIWYYFDRPTNLAFHDLTSFLAPPKNLRSLLGLDLKFCPSPRFLQSSINSSFEHFKKDLFCKTYFAGREMNDTSFDPKLHIGSTWCPRDWMIPHPIHRTSSLFRKQ